MGDPNTGEIYRGTLRKEGDVPLDVHQAEWLKSLPVRDRIAELQEMGRKLQRFEPTGESPSNAVPDSGGVPMSRFYLNRIKDETGVSRTGRVLEGVLTQSGQVIAQWRQPHTSIGIYGSFQEFLTIHVDCHPSCSEVVWLDTPPNCPGATG